MNTTLQIITQTESNFRNWRQFWNTLYIQPDPFQTDSKQKEEQFYKREKVKREMEETRSWRSRRREAEEKPRGWYELSPVVVFVTE